MINFLKNKLATPLKGGVDFLVFSQFAFSQLVWNKKIQILYNSLD